MGYPFSPWDQRTTRQWGGRPVRHRPLARLWVALGFTVAVVVALGLVVLT
ncbi:hypothetical protein ACXPWS_11695 [Mycobacterium sp. BMJ-28]